MDSLNVCVYYYIGYLTTVLYECEGSRTLLIRRERGKWEKGWRAKDRSGYERSQLAKQVYINSGWSIMTPTHKNVNEDIRNEGDERKNMHTEDPEEASSVRTGLDNVPLKGGRQ